MKILCVCQGGNVRSVTLAYILKYQYGQDALAVGWEPNSTETKNLLYKWADVIILVEDQFKKHIPKRFHKKLRVVEIGPDRWFMSLHPDLMDGLNTIDFKKFLGI